MNETAASLMRTTQSLLRVTRRQIDLARSVPDTEFKGGSSDKEKHLKKLERMEKRLCLTLKKAGWPEMEEGTNTDSD